MHPEAKKPTKLNNKINQVLIKELTQKTQLINQGLFQELIYLIKAPEQKKLRNRYPQGQFKYFYFVWTRR